MPIPTSQINRDWISLPKTTTILELQQRVPRERRRIQWLVTAMTAQDYAVYRVSDLIDFLVNTRGLKTATGDLMKETLEQQPSFLQTCTRAAVDVNADWQNVNETWSPLADPPLVVLDHGNAVGILKSELRGSSAADMSFLDHVQVTSTPKGAEIGGTSKAIPPLRDQPGPGTLGAPGPEPVAAPTRFINAVLQDHDNAVPLQLGETYTVVFSVELEKLAASVAAETFREQNLFPEGVDQVELLVQLLSDDFAINSDPQKLIVPRTGKSKNKARFDIEPTKNGAGELTAVFIKDGNAVQAIKLTLNVGMADKPGVLGSQPLGRQLESAGVLKPRDLLLWIENTGTNYTLRILDKVPMRATLPLTPMDLDNAVTQARQALQSIVDLDLGGKVFQTVTKIPAPAREQAMPILAKAGYLLFQELFYHPNADAQTRKMGDYLRNRALTETLKIQIVSDSMMLPWSLLYMEDTLDINNIKPESFLGLKHIVEHIPFQEGTGYSEKINSQPRLTISLNLNTEIDQQMHFPLIQNQLDYWQKKQPQAGLEIIKRTSGNDVMSALANAATTDQIMYFYCHAETAEFAQGGANASQLQFGKGQSLTLSDLKAFAPTKTRLGTLPLVFINACESAQLSPLFYNGFMPYLVDKGARGMIGSECQIPALFAMEWSFKFFDRLLAGDAIGQIFLDLRRDYFFNSNNPLGLLYALYCDADTQITPPLQ